MDRWAAQSVRTTDLVTHRADPRDIAAVYGQLATDRTVVVPVLEWWRLPGELRSRPGPQLLPNPARRGLDTGWRPPPHDASVEPPVVDHPTPSPLRLQARPGGTDEQRARAAAAALQTLGTAGRVEVLGQGPAADRLAAILDAAGRQPATPDERADVIVDTAPTAASVTSALEQLPPCGTLVVAGPVEPVDLDIQTLVHRKGLLVVGVPAHGPAMPDESTSTAADHTVAQPVS
jgi:hypothetical protein